MPFIRKRTRRELREEYEGAAHAIAWTPIALAAILVLAGIGALIWWLGVASSGVAGSGNITKQRNSAQNITQWSATFNSEYSNIQADVANLGALKSAQAAPGATQQDRTNYTGAILVCNQDVASYNKDLKNILAVVPSGLPETPFTSTYCEGATQ